MGNERRGVVGVGVDSFHAREDDQIARMNETGDPRGGFVVIHAFVYL